MNSLQKVIVWVAVAVGLLMFLCPPYYYSSIQNGFSFLLSTDPERINRTFWYGEFILLGLLTAVAYFSVKGEAVLSSAIERTIKLGALIVGLIIVVLIVAYWIA